MKKELHNDLLARYFNGTASEADLKEVAQWLKEDAANESELKQLDKVWTNGQSQKQSFDTTKAWQKVASQTVKAPKRNKASIYKVAAGIAAIFAIGLLLWFFTSSNSVEMLSYQTTKESKEITLPDGSKITLNAYSSLQFPEKFTENERNVSMIGEAFFEVMENPTKPFKIDINTTEVTVLGTSFNIDSRDTATVVSVKTGKVKFGIKKGLQVELIKNQEAKYIARKDSITPTVTVDPNVFAFKTRVFYFENTSLTNVVERLSKAYHVDIKLDDKSWANYNLTATFERQKLDTVLDVISETLNISVRKEGEQYYIEKKANIQ